ERKCRSFARKGEKPRRWQAAERLENRQERRLARGNNLTEQRPHGALLDGKRDHALVLVHARAPVKPVPVRNGVERIEEMGIMLCPDRRPSLLQTEISL